MPILDFYSSPGSMTKLPETVDVSNLPRDVTAIVRCVQGVLLHQHWASAYGVALTSTQKAEPHLRSVAQMLDKLDRDDPLAARSPDRRLVGVCRHFTVLLVALLRAKGFPARARCGFATYFKPSHFVDHWVGEYWNADEARWVLVDAQLDKLQRRKTASTFDPHDVPRDRFLVAGDGWVLCRAGRADPARFGIMDLHGLWFVSANLVRDLAALNDREMLPWDLWGAMVHPGERFDDERLILFDRVAELTREPDRSFADLRRLYRDDPRLAVPSIVFNALRQQPEPA